jgi:hypothetical protein
VRRTSRRRARTRRCQHNHLLVIVASAGGCGIALTNAIDVVVVEQIVVGDGAYYWHTQSFALCPQTHELTRRIAHIARTFVDFVFNEMRESQQKSIAISATVHTMMMYVATQTTTITAIVSDDDNASCQSIETTARNAQQPTRRCALHVTMSASSHTRAHYVGAGQGVCSHVPIVTIEMTTTDTARAHTNVSSRHHAHTHTPVQRK